MKYIAFLRGINVGGNNLIKMSDLKKKFEDLGFQNVKTVIASGNVIFETDKKDFNKIPYTAVVLSQSELKDVINNAPKSWKDNNLRKYVAFILGDVTPLEVSKEITLKENIDYLNVGKKVLYMTTKLEGLSKSSFKNLIKTKYYKNLTIRNYNTVKKCYGTGS